MQYVMSDFAIGNWPNDKMAYCTVRKIFDANKWPGLSLREGERERFSLTFCH